MEMFQTEVGVTPAYLTTDQVRVHFNLRNANTVRRWAKQGAPHLRIATSDLRWDVVEVEEWLNAKSKEAEASTSG